VDVLIFGGGVAGLWLLDELSRQHYSVLLIEARALGSGQTVASQGIIHGGLKYTLTGSLTSSAQMIRQMPLIWRDCLAGKRLPDLAAVQLRSDFCYLWRTESLKSQLGMVGARVGLRVKPNRLAKRDWPEVLAQCPGSVYRLDEQVIRPTSFVEELARPWVSRMLLAQPKQVAFECTGPGLATMVRLTQDERDGAPPVSIKPGSIILAAGAGNAALRQQLGLDPAIMQRRPLHMVMARGANLPDLNGHCVDGSKTRVTITTDHDALGRRIWQVGGQIGEDGVALEPEALVRHTIDEVRASLPGIDLSEVEWSTYRVDRAEASTDAGRRPDDVHLSREGQTFTAWPTKLALAPRLAEQLVARLDRPFHAQPSIVAWPQPPVANGPWDEDRQWWSTSELTSPSPGSK
jgi:glycine/D-amino acid oxidase-like deaminating enzyme